MGTIPPLRSQRAPLARRRPQVALFLPSLDVGGAERVMVNLATGFVERGLSVDVVLVKARGPYLADVPRTARIVDLKAAKVFTSLPSLVRYLRRERPLALLSTLDHANLVALLARRIARVPTRAVVRQAVALSVDVRGRRRGIDRLTTLAARYLYPWADEIVAVSEGVARDLALVLGMPLERIRIVPSPIVTPALFALASEPLDHPWFVPGQDPVVLGVGRLTAQKDFPTLIRAVAMVRPRRPVRLMILGDGESRSSLEALVKELDLENVVSLPGLVQNPFAYMANAAVFVLSSAWEGSPGVLVQALACGVPVVATNCDSGPWEILRGGRLGRLAAVGDAPGIAKAILEALDQPRGSSADGAWRPFSLDVAVDGYLRVLQAGTS